MWRDSRVDPGVYRSDMAVRSGVGGAVLRSRAWAVLAHYRRRWLLRGAIEMTAGSGS